MKNLEERISRLEQRVKNIEVGLGKNAGVEKSIREPNEKISINEFLRTKMPKDDVKRALAIAYWLDYFEKVDVFNISDLEDAFRLARFVLPKNLHDKVNLNIKNGHIAENKEKKNNKKAWYVTNTGAEFVENNFSKT